MSERLLQLLAIGVGGAGIAVTLGVIAAGVTFVNSGERNRIDDGAGTCGFAAVHGMNGKRFESHEDIISPSEPLIIWGTANAVIWIVETREKRRVAEATRSREKQA